MRRNKRKSRNEFRYNYDTGHIVYVFEEEKSKYKGLGITHSKRTFRTKNMPLFYNPQKGKKQKAYIRNGIINKKKSSFAKHSDKRFKFSFPDFRNVKSKIRNFKKLRRKRK